MNKEERYIQFCYGLPSSLPLLEAPDGFRTRHPWRDVDYLLSIGWKLVTEKNSK